MSSSVKNSESKYYRFFEDCGPYMITHVITVEEVVIVVPFISIVEMVGLVYFLILIGFSYTTVSLPSLIKACLFGYDQRYTLRGVHCLWVFHLPC